MKTPILLPPPTLIPTPTPSLFYNLNAYPKNIIQQTFRDVLDPLGTIAEWN